VRRKSQGLCDARITGLNKVRCALLSSRLKCAYPWLKVEVLGRYSSKARFGQPETFNQTFARTFERPLHPKQPTYARDHVDRRPPPWAAMIMLVASVSASITGTGALRIAIGRGSDPIVRQKARELKDRKPAPKVALSATHGKRLSERESIRDSTNGSRRPGPFSPQSFLAHLARNPVDTLLGRPC